MSAGFNKNNVINLIGETVDSLLIIPAPPISTTNTTTKDNINKPLVSDECTVVGTIIEPELSGEMQVIIVCSGISS